MDVRKIVIMLIVGCVAVMLPTLADARDDDYAVVTIKKKYFIKRGRHEVGPTIGIIPNDSFKLGTVIGGSWGYHIREDIFIEVPGAFVLNTNTDSTDFLEDQLGVRPETDDINWYTNAQVGWSPIYGKLNFLGKKIIYFDMNIYTGFGITGTEAKAARPTAVFGISQRFFLNRWMALRFDVKDHIVIRDSSASSTIRNVVYITGAVNFFLPTTR